MTSSTDAFRAARDLLLAHRTDYDTARREFAWPELDEFNWALDWFDVIAAEHPDRTGLRIVGDDGSDVSLSFGSLSARSAQIANWLRGLGVRRGDRVLLMLGNVAPLWEVILAAMKLGAVIIPASTLLQPADLADRIARGQVRHVITETAQLAKFGTVPGDWTRVVVDGPAVPAGIRTRTRSRAGLVHARGRHPGRRPAAALLHLGHHGPAQARRAHPGQLPGGAPVHHVLDRHPAGRRAPEPVLPRMGQARLEQPVRAVERGGHRAGAEPGAVLRGRAAGRARAAAR